MLAEAVVRIDEAEAVNQALARIVGHFQQGRSVGAESVAAQPEMNLHEDGVGKTPLSDATEKARTQAHPVSHQAPSGWYFCLCSSTRRSHSSFDTPAIWAKASSTSTPPVCSISATASAHSASVGSQGQ